jgi:predicted NBD/HSP70 family sugar kinase
VNTGGLITSRQMERWGDQQLLHFTLSQPEKSDATVRGIVRQMAAYLGLVIGNLAALLNPQVVVSSGEMMVLAEHMLVEVRNQVEDVYPFPLELTLYVTVGLRGGVGIAKMYAIDQLIR